MKAFKFIGMLFAAFALSFTATSCGDDDVDDIIEGGITSGSMSSDLKKSDSQLVLTLNYPTHKIVTTAKFSNALCTSYIIEITYLTDAWADAAWKAYEAENKESGSTVYKRNGKTITANLSEDFKGVEYDVILTELEHQKRAFDSAASQM